MKKDELRYVLVSVLTIAIIFVIAFFTREEPKEVEVVLTDAEKFAEEYTSVSKDNVFIYKNSLAF